MDVVRLLADYNVPFVISSEEWTNIHCPFCAGSQDYHLGISRSGGCHCWRCGGHTLRDVLVSVLRIPPANIRSLLQKYKDGPVRVAVPEAKVKIQPFKYPKPYCPLTAPYKRYLIGRGFDPEKLEAEWGVLQTGPVSFLDGIAYSHRILIPISWGGEVVSFQARDITHKSDLKYVACPKKRELIHHKDILYGNQAKWGKTAIVVEGVTDVWRLGTNAVATFGIAFKMEQVLQLAKHFSRLVILFDSEPQAQQQARSLMVKLRTLGKAVELETIEDDPGSMKQEDANHLVRQILGKRR